MKYLRTFLVYLTMAFFGAVLPAARADVVRIKSFGFPQRSIWHPAGLIVGSDGKLYGTSANGGAAGYGSIFKVDKDGSNLEVIHIFPLTGDGRFPLSRLLEGTNGLLYGATAYGGSNDLGTIFSIDKSGTNYQIVHHFDTNDASPRAALIQGRDGFLYGTTWNPGSIFKLNPTDGSFQVLHQFENNGFVNIQPNTALLEGSDGALYGSTGGSMFFNGHLIFKINPDGSGYQELFTFDNPTNGLDPSELIEGTDARLYGAAGFEGLKFSGTIFSLNKDGSDFKVIYNFSGGKGGAEPIKVAQGSDGLLYGITFNDGKAYSGTVFVIATNGNRFKILQSLGTRTSIGDHPTDLLVDGAGTNLALYGVTQSGGQTDAGILFRLTPERGKYAVLSQFDLYGADGVEPNTPLCQGADGMLYGTTLIGGTRNLGTIFRMNTNGSGYQVLWHFAGGRNGSNPVGVVVNSANGSVFGTTAGFYTPGGEIVFRLNTNGTFLAIHHFTGTNDGAAPNPLLLGSDGFLYGTAFEAGPLGGGSVFRMRMNGSSFMVLHSFPLQTSPQKGGSYPAASLIEGPNGALYGTTTYGGSNNAGTIFTLHKDGSNFKLIHHFTMADGGPMAPLLAASDGKLYGSATFYAGVDTNTYFAYSVGSIFRINPDGSQYEELHTFSVYTNDVYAPVGPLIEGNDSAIYGAARFSGVSPSGPEPGGLYKMNNDGSGFQVLHIFVSDPNGSNPLGTYPRSGLLKTSDGGIFGTTDWGGDMGAGTVFQYVPDP